MWAYLGLGLGLGLSAGISPGPLLALVITASLRNGLAGGLAVALAPLATDVPIIVVSVLAIGRLPPEFLRWVGALGGLVVIWMGIEILRSARETSVPTSRGTTVNPSRELWRGVTVNALNPHPYLFWATIGGPVLVSTWRTSPWYAVAFLASFYALLIGSKVLVAWLVSHQASGLSTAWYQRLLLGCGLVMFVVAGMLFWQAWRGG
jgi:threonine/homoserine/homoserine lactone efflux protein